MVALDGGSNLPVVETVAALDGGSNFPVVEMVVLDGGSNILAGAAYFHTESTRDVEWRCLGTRLTGMKSWKSTDCGRVCDRARGVRCVVAQRGGECVAVVVAENIWRCDVAEYWHHRKHLPSTRLRNLQNTHFYVVFNICTLFLFKYLLIRWSFFKFNFVDASIVPIVDCLLDCLLTLFLSLQFLGNSVTTSTFNFFEFGVRRSSYKLSFFLTCLPSFGLLVYGLTIVLFEGGDVDNELTIVSFERSDVVDWWYMMGIMRLCFNENNSNLMLSTPDTHISKCH